MFLMGVYLLKFPSFSPLASTPLDPALVIWTNLPEQKLHSRTCWTRLWCSLLRLLKLSRLKAGV